MAFIGLLFINNAIAQQLVQIAGMAVYSGWSPLVYKWVTIYLSPELLGTATGMIFTLGGLLQLGINIVVPSIMAGIYSDLRQYIWPLSILSGITALSGLAFSISTISATIPTKPFVVDEKGHVVSGEEIAGNSTMINT